MIIFTIYLLLFCFLIYRTSFFGILKDDSLNSRFYLAAFLIKVTAIGAFYILYTKLYGSIQYSDTGNYYRDSKAIHDIAGADPKEFIKLMFGFSENGKGTFIFENYLKQTTTWDQSSDELMYNDNRLMLRFHALLHFISGGNYYVHALFSCLLGFLGINWVYKAFKELFKGKEIYLFLIWVLFPGVWFWTGALFKEGPALFLMGWLLISLKRTIVLKRYSFKNALMALIGVTLSFLFKPYLMIPVLITTILFFVTGKLTRKNAGLKYTIALFIVLLAGNYSCYILFKKDAVKILSQRQRDFLDMSNGGLFLLGPDKFIRTPYNYELLRIDSSQTEVKAKLKAGVPYTYWEHSHQQDTLYCRSNTDTNTVYTLLYYVPKAHSTLHGPKLDGTWTSFIKAIPYAIYIGALKPLFFDARNTMDRILSFETLIILISILVFLYNGIRAGFRSAYYVYFISVVFLVLLLIGITSPNIGAIERYRCLVIPFLLMTALLSSTISDSEKLSIFFKNKRAERE